MRGQNRRAAVDTRMAQPGFRGGDQARRILQPAFPGERAGDGLGIVQEYAGGKERFLADFARVDQLRDGKQLDGITVGVGKRAVRSSEIDADGGGGRGSGQSPSIISATALVLLLVSFVACRDDF